MTSVACGTRSRRSVNAWSSTPSPLRRSARPTNRIRPFTLGAPSAGAYFSTGTPLGMIRYGPGNRLCGNALAASLTATRTSMRFITAATTHLRLS